MPEARYDLSRIELWVRAVLRVPPDPQPPEGSPESIRVFRAGRNYIVWCMIVWFLSHLLVFALLLGFFLLGMKVLHRLPEWLQIVWRVAELMAALVFIALAVFTYFSQRLNYALRWYIVTDRSLRIRTGILWLQELTMTFSNVQEIRLSAGPLQKLLKLSDVEVQSAGGGSDGKGGNSHIGRFEGVSNGDEIRDLLRERLRQYRDSGLGEAAPQNPALPDGSIDAAHLVLSEVRALRASLS
jgi:membrane protein YdbS with pleckstrin-like domain